MLNTHIRWSIREDMPAIMAIENAAFPQPWSEADFEARLKMRNCIVFVAEVGRILVGYMMFEHGQKTTEVVNIAVAEQFRRHGVGAKLLSKAVDKSLVLFETDIRAEVRESNIVAHHFLRACGFRADSVCRNMYHDTGESGYLFSRVHKGTLEPAVTEKSAK